MVAARHDRFRHLVQLGRTQRDVEMRGRLLQHLEDGLPRALRQTMALVDDEHPHTGTGQRHVIAQLDQQPHGVDAVV